MAIKVDELLGYGSGALGDVEIADGAVKDLNSYARVVGIGANTLTLDVDNLVLGSYERFRAGEDVLVHVSATNGDSAEKLGRYIVARITLVSKDTLTLDKDFSLVLTDRELDYYYVQAVTFANFDCLTLKSGAIVTVPPYDPFKNVGGILAIKCWDKLELAGGSIDLRDSGIPWNRKNGLRPLVSQETAANGESDNAKYSGWENFQTQERFLLNAGDGACIIVTKRLICHEDSRIGNIETHGAQYCRGASNSVGVKPSNITNIGGSSILLVAETIERFTPRIIAKYRDSRSSQGKGLSRCYIASKTKLRNDEGLYAYDVISDERRLEKELGVKCYGDGSFGVLENPGIPLNNYARVIGIEQGGHKLRIADETLRGLAPIRTGSLVLVQVIQRSEREVDAAGRIVVARVISRESEKLILDVPAPEIELDKYIVQVISVPQFRHYRQSAEYNLTPKFENGVGGVCAIAAADTCDLTDGRLNVEGKGGAVGYGRAGLGQIGNAQDSDKLPLGSGHGSVFILTKKLVMNGNTRVGAKYSGEGTGGRLGGNNSDGSNQGGGYSGAFDENGRGSGGGYVGGGAGSEGAIGGLGGSGAAGGLGADLSESTRTETTGGYGGNGGSKLGGSQGAHILVIADKIEGFNQAAFSTGGAGGAGGVNGAAGYGGGGGTSAGGSSGWCFIYTNEAT